MENIIISIIVHDKGRHLWSITTASIDNSFFTRGSHTFLLFCDQGNLKAQSFFSPVFYPREVLSQPFPPAYPSIPQSDPVAPPCCWSLSREATNSWWVSTIFLVLNTTESTGNSRAAPSVSKQGTLTCSMKTACLQNFCNIGVVRGIRSITVAYRSIRGCSCQSLLNYNSIIFRQCLILVNVNSDWKRRYLNIGVMLLPKLKSMLQSLELNPLIRWQ